MLLTVEQKRQLAARARAENLSLSAYMRCRAIDDGELIRALAGALERWGREGRHARDETIARLERGTRGPAGAGRGPHGAKGVEQR